MLGCCTGHPAPRPQATRVAVGRNESAAEAANRAIHKLRSTRTSGLPTTIANEPIPRGRIYWQRGSFYS
jgi:hypothetical protein